MKKIVFFVTTLNSGGIENYLLRFLSFFDGQIEPVVICKGNLFGELEGDYRKIKNIQLIKMDIGYFNLNSYYKVYELLKNNNIDTICDFTGNFSGLILFAANLAGIKNRIAFYRNSAIKFKKSFFKLFYNALVRLMVLYNATKIFSNSETALIYFYPNKYKDDIRFKVINNGIDFLSFLSSESLKKTEFDIPEKSFIIGHSGRYDSQKNHITILKVAEKICEKYDNIYIILCGKNTDVYLSEIVLKNDILKGKVKILGYRNDINSILPIFDLFFFPSTIEGQPNSLIEAMIAGLPIIASNINPIKETTPKILHKELIDPFDVDGFCSRIEEYYLSKKKRDRSDFSDWAKERFDSNILFNQFYKEL